MKSILTFFSLRYWITHSERISRKSRHATARRQMINNLTLCISCTSAGTRIRAFVIDAGPVWRTVRVQSTLRPATFVRISYKFRNACARSGSILFFANRVWSARGWHARVNGFWTRSCLLTDNSKVMLNFIKLWVKLTLCHVATLEWITEVAR